MTDLPPNLALLVGVLIVSAAAALVAWLLRLSRFPGGAFGAAIAGGVLAGLLLGPAGLSRLRPTWYEHAFVGGVKEREALEDLQAQHAAEVAALRQAGVTPEAIQEHIAEQQRNQSPMHFFEDAARAEQRERARNAVHAFVVVLGFGFILHPNMMLMRRSAAITACRLRGTPAREKPGLWARCNRSVPLRTAIAAYAWLAREMTRVTACWGGAVLLAGVYVAIVGVPACVALAVWARAPIEAAGAITVAFIVCLVPRSASRTLLRAIASAALLWVTLCTVCVSCFPNGIALETAARSCGFGLILGSLVALFLLCSGVRHPRVQDREYFSAESARASARRYRLAARFLRTLLLGVCLPALAALLSILCDPRELAPSRGFWVVALVAVVWSSLGRALGLLAVRRIIRERVTFVRCLRDIPAGTGALQLLASAMFFAFQGIDEPAMAALVLGALAVEVVTWVARSVCPATRRSREAGQMC